MTELWAFYKISTLSGGHPCPMDTFLVISCITPFRNIVSFCAEKIKHTILVSKHARFTDFFKDREP